MVETCADFAQRAGLSSFIVVSPINRNASVSWLCGGWPARHVDTVGWKTDVKIGAVYGYSLPQASTAM